MDGLSPLLMQRDGGGCIGRLSRRVNLNSFGIVPSMGDDAIGSQLFGFLPTHRSDDNDTNNGENSATDVWEIEDEMTAADTLDAAGTNIAGTRRSDMVREIHIRRNE